MALPTSISAHGLSCGILVPTRQHSPARNDPGLVPPFCAEHGRLYYSDPDTRVSSWDKPDSLEWEEHLDDDGVPCVWVACFAGVPQLCSVCGEGRDGGVPAATASQRRRPWTSAGARWTMRFKPRPPPCPRRRFYYNRATKESSRHKPVMLSWVKKENEGAGEL